MSRRGNFYDNAVAESFFQLLKRERIKRRIYTDRQAARVDIFDYIEMFYNRQRKHGYNDMLAPVEYERRYFMKFEGVYETQGDSESDIKELLDDAARRDKVINILGRPDRQYESDISYRACRKGAGVFWAIVIPFIAAEGGVHRGEMECFELVLYFSNNDRLTRYEKIPFYTPFSNKFKTPDGEALHTIRTMAEKGIPESQWRLYNEYGRKPEDVIWLCHSADNGYAKAQLHVGHLYWAASDIPDNRTKAYAWYKLAATGDKLQGLLSDDKTQNKADSAMHNAEKALTSEQLAEAETLYAGWKPGECELELLSEIIDN